MHYSPLWDSIMQLSKQESYALRLTLDLATNPPAPIREIARRQRIPPAYLGKIVQSLARGGIVHTERGARGGVSLARSPESISLRQVLEAAQGPITLSRCVSEPGHDCPTNSLACPIRRVTMRLQHMVTRELASVSLADLAAMRGESPNATIG
jgi:Rrf2 family protein